MGSLVSHESPPIAVHTGGPACNAPTIKEGHLMLVKIISFVPVNKMGILKIISKDLRNCLIVARV
jgi:hypothetical protein